MNDPKPFPMDSIRPFYPGVDEAALPNVGLKLAKGLRHTTRQTRRRFAMLTQTKKAVEQLQSLPAADGSESIHLVLSGEFSLWHLVLAVLEIGAQPISELVICTLGFSKSNIDNLSELIDSGQVKRAAILCSHYFQAQDREIYDHAVELFRKHGFQICAMRTHAKILLIAQGERRLVVSSSANARSNFNSEQADIFEGATNGLHAFHRAWIQDMLDRGTARSMQ